MESDDPGVLGPMLFLLLLMLPPLMNAGSFRPRILGWRNSNYHLSQDWEGFKQSASYRRSQTDTDNQFRFCDDAFDLYFVVDTSDNVRNNWNHIYKYVNALVKKYRNPKLRMSFITYSTHGQTLMKLTSDRKKIQEGLNKLQNIVPSGDINMQKGLEKANEQIQQVYSRDKKTTSLIITLTGGLLEPEVYYATMNEASKARNMGAKVYSMGLNDYYRQQLIRIVQGERHVYEEKDYNSLEDLVNSLVDNSCLDVTGKDTYFVCIGEVYNLAFVSHSLQQSKLNEYVCRYTVENTTVFTKNAINIKNGKLICPGHVFEKPGKVITVHYSLNNGVTFQDTTLKMTSRSCGKKSTGPPATPLPSTVSPSTSVPIPPPHIPPKTPPTRPPAPQLPRPPTLPPTRPAPRPPITPSTRPPAPPRRSPPTPPTTRPPAPPPPRPPTPPPTRPPAPPPTRPPTPPPTRPPAPPPTRPPTPPPTRPPAPPPPRPPTPPPTRPPTPTSRSPPTPPPTRPPALPPTHPPTPPTRPPAPPPPRPPTPPPTRPPTPTPQSPPTPLPTRPPTPTPRSPPTPPPTRPPALPPTHPPTPPPTRPPVLPPHRPPPPPPALSPTLPPHPWPPPQFTPIINRLYFIVLIPALLMFLLLLWCIWCCKKMVKNPPPVQEKAPKSCHIQTCPTVIVPCGGYQEDRIQSMEEKYFNITLVKCHCAQIPCGPKLCLAPSQECFPLNSCCSSCQYPPHICCHLPQECCH